MEKIPLFPLNMVLFPGAPLPLHVFEPRYLEMINYCTRDENIGFGVVLIRQGEEALGPLAEPYMIGCTAVIDHFEDLADGSQNIMTHGVERFQIYDLYDDQPYLTATIVRLPYLTSPEDELESAGKRVLELVSQYVEQTAPGNEAQIFEMFGLGAARPPMLTFHLAAALLEIPDREKQMLLEKPSEALFARETLRLYRRELRMLTLMDGKAYRRQRHSSWMN